jgi:DNA-binding NtrC family response regulator
MSRRVVSLLIIDPHEGDLEMLASSLVQPDVEILTAADPDKGIDILHEKHPEIVLTALLMPNVLGMEFSDRVRAFDPSTEVILLDKPVSIPALRERISTLVENARERLRASELQDELLEGAEFEGIVGNSPVMWDMFSRIRRIAPHYHAVLVTGETGSGKDLVARAFHRLSSGRSGRYVVLNCSAVVETLFESELFGHVRGSYTGAAADKAGLFEHAHGGTLFLDEIGDMPLGTQAKLLRVLQSQEVQRVGSLTTRKVDVRVVAATNHDLRAAIEEKRFREDLFYRLAMVEIQVPTLAQRKEDFPLLEQHFIKRFASQYGKHIRGLTQRAQIVLRTHAWPGNVRELENVIGHACMMCVGDTLDVTDLPRYMQRPDDPRHSATAAVDETGARSREDQEQLMVRQALEEAKGNQSQAARILKIGRDALRYKVKKLNL